MAVAALLLEPGRGQAFRDCDRLFKEMPPHRCEKRPDFKRLDISLDGFILVPMELTREEAHYARVEFQLLIYQSNGQQYQDLFVRVMSDRRPGFKAIKPHGNQGDRKNDGYEPKEGRYYQVFAPENPNKAVAAAVKKAREDFVGLSKYWQKISPIRDFRFVFNDKFLGLTRRSNKS